jgi:hypothetical protein
MDMWRPPDFREERMRKLRLKTPAGMVADYFRLFVNRRAYTLQSDRPHAESGRHYYFRPSDKKTGQGLSLTPDTLQGHIEGEITIALYVINPATQRCKWVAIDADYQNALPDLIKLGYYLKQDGVESALEKSNRGGHLWIFMAEPQPARDCRIYVYDLALRLGVPVKGGGLREGIEVFPKHDELKPGEYGNAIRGPFPPAALMGQASAPQCFSRVVQSVVLVAGTRTVISFMAPKSRLMMLFRKCYGPARSTR